MKCIQIHRFSGNGRDVDALADAIAVAKDFGFDTLLVKALDGVNWMADYDGGADAISSAAGSRRAARPLPRSWPPVLRLDGPTARRRPGRAGRTYEPGGVGRRWPVSRRRAIRTPAELTPILGPAPPGGPGQVVHGAHPRPGARRLAVPAARPSPGASRRDPARGVDALRQRVLGAALLDRFRTGHGQLAQPRPSGAGAGRRHRSDVEQARAADLARHLDEPTVCAGRSAEQLRRFRR